jgi:hypothetical protein
MDSPQETVSFQHTACQQRQKERLTRIGKVYKLKQYSTS